MEIWTSNSTMSAPAATAFLSEAMEFSRMLEQLEKQSSFSQASYKDKHDQISYCFSLVKEFPMPLWPTSRPFQCAFQCCA